MVCQQHSGLPKFFKLLDEDVAPEKAFERAGNPTTFKNAMRAYKKFKGSKEKAGTVLTPWAQYMVVLVLQFIWRQRGSKPRGSGLRVSINRRRSRHLQALRCIREASNSCPPAR